jgi:hypothetical protein
MCKVLLLAWKFSLVNVEAGILKYNCRLFFQVRHTSFWLVLSAGQGNEVARSPKRLMRTFVWRTLEV